MIPFLNRRKLLARMGVPLAATVGSSGLAAAAAAQPAAANTCGRVQSVLDAGARGDGSADDHGAIMAAVGALGTRGGSVFFPAGIYAVSRPVEKPTSVRFVGEGARSSIIRATGAASAFPSAVVTSEAGSATARRLLFSTGLAHLGIDAAGLVETCLLVRGDQENCIYEDLVLANFLASGLKLAALRETTHGAAFRDLHVIPNARGTRAAKAIVLADTVKCTFENITTDKANRADGGDGPYAVGIEVGRGSVLNLFTAIHTEDTLIGIDNQSPLNTFIGLQAYSNYGGSTAHFRNGAVSYVLLNLQTLGTPSDYKFHVQDLFGGDVEQVTDRSTAARILQTEGGKSTLISTQGPSTYVEPLAVQNLQQRGSSEGTGIFSAVASASLGPGQRRDLRITAVGVSGAASLAGKISLFGTGKLPLVQEAAFIARVAESGAVSGENGGSAPVLGQVPLIVIGPESHPKPGAGRFKVGLRNGDQNRNLELSVRIELACDAHGISGLSLELV